MSALLELAERCEAETRPGEQRALLMAAYEAVFGGPECIPISRWPGYSSPRWDKFTAQLNAEAYESAALTLVPEGLNIRMGTNAGAPWAQVRKDALSDYWNGNAATLALAICAAALRARSGGMTRRRLRGLGKGPLLMTSVKPGDVAYYLEAFVDESLPLKLEDVTLEGWAKWLANGGDQDGADVESCWKFGPPADGHIFDAWTFTFLDDVTVRRCALSSECDFDNDEFEFSPALPDRSTFDFVACRYGPGLGWDGDSILDPDDISDGLKDVMDVGDDAFLALASSKRLKLRYHSSPPRLEEVNIQ